MSTLTPSDRIVSDCETLENVVYSSLPLLPDSYWAGVVVPVWLLSIAQKN